VTKGSRANEATVKLAAEVDAPRPAANRTKRQGERRKTAMTPSKLLHLSRFPGSFSPDPEKLNSRKKTREAFPRTGQESFHAALNSSNELTNCKVLDGHYQELLLKSFWEDLTGRKSSQRHKGHKELNPGSAFFVPFVPLW
jgi:hypothetical protein